MYVILAGLVAIGVVARLMAHIPNFAPITALALVAGYYLRGRSSILVPLVAMLISDAVIGFYAWPVMVAVYGSYVVAWLLGSIASRRGVSSLVPATLASSLIFFFVTNAAVWAFTGLYAKTLSGLGQSYVMAIPFFRASLFSDVIFTAAFVAVIEASRAFMPATQLVKAETK